MRVIDNYESKAQDLLEKFTDPLEDQNQEAIQDQIQNPLQDSIQEETSKKEEGGLRFPSQEAGLHEPHAGEFCRPQRERHRGNSATMGWCRNKY